MLAKETDGNGALEFRLEPSLEFFERPTGDERFGRSVEGRSEALLEVPEQGELAD